MSDSDYVIPRNKSKPLPKPEPEEKAEEAPAPETDKPEKLDEPAVLYED